jgi:tetratricopeptide (TPR) repeat protein
MMNERSFKWIVAIRTSIGWNISVYAVWLVVSVFSTCFGQTEPSQNQDSTLPPLNGVLSESGLEIIAEGQAVANHLAITLPTTLDAQEMLARYELEFGDPHKAKEIWSRLAEAQPNYAFALKGLGDVATMDGELQDAVKYYRRAVVAEPANLERQLTLAVGLVLASQLEEAQKLLNAILQKDPNNAQAHVELGGVDLQLQKYESARDHFELARESLPDLPAIHLGLMNAYLRLGDSEKAKPHKERYQELRSAVASKSERDHRRYDDVKALRIDVAKFFVDMARVYASGGKSTAAELLLIRAMRMDPASVEPRRAMAAFAMAKGKPFGAIRWLTEVSELLPNDYTLVKEIVKLYVDQSMIPEAERLLVDYAERQPDRAEVQRSVALFFVEVNPSHEKSLTYAERALNASRSADILALISSIHERNGDIAQSIDYMKQAMTLAPLETTYQQLHALLVEKQSKSEQIIENGKP